MFLCFIWCANCTYKLPKWGVNADLIRPFFYEILELEVSASFRAGSSEMATEASQVLIKMAGYAWPWISFETPHNPTSAGVCLVYISE